MNIMRKCVVTVYSENQMTSALLMYTYTDTFSS